MIISIAPKFLNEQLIREKPAETSFLVDGFAYSSGINGRTNPTYFLFSRRSEGRVNPSCGNIIYIPTGFFERHLKNDHGLLNQWEIVCLPDICEKGCLSKISQYGISLIGY